MKKLTKKFIAIAIILSTYLVPQKGICGGPVIISGLDVEYGIRPGNSTHGTIAMWASVINTGILTNVTSCGALVNPTGNILVIGGGKGPFATDHMTNFWTQIGTTLPRGITFVNGAANITAQSFAGFSMIAVCNTTDGAGKLNAAEMAALNARQADIANFVNCGGGLYASACDITPAYGYINIGSPSLISVPGGGSGSTPTALGTPMGLPSISGPFHNTFSQWPSFLSILANLDTKACILGGKNVTIPPTWITSIPTGCFCCGSDIYQLPATPPITGPATLSCDAATVYSTNSCPGASYTWSVSPSVPFTGQGTNSISITGPYSPFVTSYTITVSIRCGTKTVTNNIVVKPGNCTANPYFSQAGDAGSMTFTSTQTGCTHWWYLVKDDDQNGMYTAGETFSGPITTPVANFSSLITDQFYTVYHYIYCQCGRYCSKYALYRFSFKWHPAQMMKMPSNINMDKPGYLNEKTKFEVVPVEFLKSLPKELKGQKLVIGYIVDRPVENEPAQTKNPTKELIKEGKEMIKQ